MLAKARIVVLDSSQRIDYEIPVMYNPTELTLSSTAEYSGEGGNLQFNQLQQEDFVVSLFFDTYEKNTDVREETSKIAALLTPQETQGSQGDRKRPPTCLFAWSTTSWYSGVITQLSQKFIMFSSEGLPLRAWLTVKFQSVLTTKKELESLGLYNCRRLRIVTARDRLDILAYETLGDSGLWRLIAKANNIADPLTFPTLLDIGKTIVIPDTHHQS